MEVGNDVAVALVKPAEGQRGRDTDGGLEKMNHILTSTF